MSTLRRGFARAERVALLCMASGLALMLLVPAPFAFRLGFFVVLGSTVAEIVCAHARGDER